MLVGLPNIVLLKV